MVAKYFPPTPTGGQKRNGRVKNYIGQDLSEQAMINRGTPPTAVQKAQNPRSTVVNQKAASVAKPNFAPSGPLRQRGAPALTPRTPNNVGKGGVPLNRGNFYEAALRRLRKMSK